MKARLPQGFSNGGGTNLQQLARQAQKLQEEMDAANSELEQKEYAEEMDRKIVSCINKMSKSDLQQAIYELLCEAPEWLVERFIYEHVN